MTFYYVAINDGCMAGTEMNRDVMPGFNLRDVAGLLCFYD
jgi:hypothetical protein